MSIDLEIECDVCKLPTSYSTTPPTVRCVDCEQVTSAIISLVRQVFRDEKPEADKEGFVKVRADDWEEMVSLLADLAELEEMKEMRQ